MNELELAQSVMVDINLVELNSGQIEGLPRNPRFIRDSRYEALVKSIKDFPKMLSYREIIIFPFGKKYLVLGGNMRLRALRELGIKKIPCKVLPIDTSVETLKELVIKDNVSFGNDDFDLLGNEWDNVDLAEWGMELPNFDVEEETVIDYSILNDSDVESQLNDMQSGVRKAIQIEFELEHYEEATLLCKFWREKNAYLGAMLIEKLKEEKEKL